MVKTKAQKSALRLLALAVFILFGMPKLSFKIGPLPLYAIDFILFTIYIRTYNFKKITSQKYSVGTIIYLLAGIAVFSELYGAIVMANFLEPVYIAVRTFLAFSIFFSVSRIVQDAEDIAILAKAALFGGLLSASLLILTSLAATRPIVTNTIFTLSFLEPAATSVEILERTEDAARGRSLIGVSILSGAFLNTIWPIMLYMRSFRKFAKKYRVYLIASLIIIPVGVIFTYSRGAILGLLLVVLGILLYNGGKSRGVIIASVSALILFFSTIGWNSEVFYFDRLTKSTARIFEEGKQTESETERLYAYTEPLEHVAQNPMFLFFGEGFARDKTFTNKLIAGRGKATHAVFAKAYYGYGMLAGLLYLTLLFYAFAVTLSYARKKAGQATNFSRALLASLLGLFPWFMLGHAVVSTTRGGIMFFFVLGLVAAQSNIHYTERYKKWFFTVKWPRIKAQRKKQQAQMAKEIEG
jgi:hypothetical protein